jgi:pSer/pThr/pTyr-binding forkhead associated (FHA) protein
VPTCRVFNREGEEIRRFDTDEPGLASPISVGRSSNCTIPLKHEAGRTVGRMHFELEQRGQAWHITNHSRTGLAKGDKKFEEGQINPGDVVRFGSCFLAFGDEAGPSPFELVWEQEDGSEGRAVLWPGRNSIGASSDNTICIKEDGISRQHARITANVADAYVEDLNSSAGTYVNGKRLKALTTVEPGAAVRLGKTRARIVRTDSMLGLDDFGPEGGRKGLVVALVALVVLITLGIVVKLLFF